MWWTLVTTTAIVALYPKLDRRGPIAVITALTLVTMLFYTVMAVFHVVFVALFLLLVWVTPGWVDRRPARGVLIATALAILLSVLSLNFLGDALVDRLDPRRGARPV